MLGLGRGRYVNLFQFIIFFSALHIYHCLERNKHKWDAKSHASQCTPEETKYLHDYVYTHIDTYN